MNSGDDCQLERILGALAIGEKVQLHMVSAKGFFSAEVERVTSELVRINGKDCIELALEPKGGRTK